MMQAFPSESRIARTRDGLYVALRPLGAALPLVSAWRRLSENAVSENLFYQPDFALAGADAFGAGVGLLIVCDGPPETADSRLLALYPCRIVHRWGVPLPALMGWTHGFSIFGAPLIDAERAEAAIDALLEAPGLLRLPPRLFMPYLPLDGRLATLIFQTQRRRGRRRADFWTHERGFLEPERAKVERDGYLTANLSTGKARQLDRFERRLSANSPVSFETVSDADELHCALDDFVALEASGWKGRLGTAIAMQAGESTFLHRLIDSYGARGQMRIDRLLGQSRSLAASIGVQTGSTFWYFKIAHAEDEARNSPGALLIRSVTSSILADESIARADSCAPPTLSLIDSFWSERLRLAHSLVEAGSGDPLFGVALGLERLRGLAGTIRNRVAPPKPKP